MDVLNGAMGLNEFVIQRKPLHFHLQIHLFSRTWGFTDVCYKEQVPLQAESDGIAFVSK